MRDVLLIQVVIVNVVVPVKSPADIVLHESVWQGMHQIKPDR